jgi:WD40 repeat protein
MRQAMALVFVLVSMSFGTAGCDSALKENQEPTPEPPEVWKSIQCEGHDGFVNSVAVSPDGKLVVSGSVDQTLRFWNAANGKLVRTVKVIDPPAKGGYSGRRVDHG